MQRCRKCEATMLQTETKCLNCGGVVEEDKPKTDGRTLFRTGIKYFMYFCGILAVVSLFVDVGPSFATLAILTVLLGLILSSAQEMLIDREKE
jgi:hypothetical protein